MVGMEPVADRALVAETEQAADSPLAFPLAVVGLAVVASGYSVVAGLRVAAVALVTAAVVPPGSSL